LLSINIYSQNEKDLSIDRSKVLVGGNIGFSFGTVTVIDVSPTIGYNITEHIAVGIGGVYKYYNDKRYTPPDKRTVWGGNIFSKYFFTENIFAHAEYEYLTYKTSIFNLLGVNETVSEWGLLLGGGYRQPISDKAYAYIILLYNFNETQYTPYQNPIIRVGIELGI